MPKVDNSRLHLLSSQTHGSIRKSKKGTTHMCVDEFKNFSHED